MLSLLIRFICHFGLVYKLLFRRLNSPLSAILTVPPFVDNFSLVCGQYDKLQLVLYCQDFPQADKTILR